MGQASSIRAVAMWMEGGKVANEMIIIGLI
jgi:hypothetical protein